MTFECDQGFVLKGSAVRRCMENGTWNGTEAICIGKLYGATCLIAFFLNLNNSFPNHSCLESPDQFDYTRLGTLNSNFCNDMFQAIILSALKSVEWGLPDL